MWGPAVPRGYSSSGSTLRGLMTNCGKPSNLSWTSARVGPVNLGISGIEVKPSDEHGDETENIVSLQTVINVYHKYDTSLQIKQYQIIQCMYMRPMGWGPGYTPPLK